MRPLAWRLLAVLSSQGVDVSDGGWPVLTSQPTDALATVIDEDALKDSERKHATMEVCLDAIEAVAGDG